MDQMLVVANLAFNIVLAVLTSWAVMSARVRDGVVIKAGLICVALGHAAVAWHLADGMSCGDLGGLTRARFVAHAGLGVVLLGLWRQYRRGTGLRELLGLHPGAGRP